jgi:transcriptional regulator with XRE-family HTH domain
MREYVFMTYHDRTPAQLDIPSSILPHLFRLSSLTTAEIRTILGVSPQVMEEYKLGRGEFSPFKFARLSEVSGLSVAALRHLVEALDSFNPVDSLKAGDKVEHPFRGAMRIEEIRGQVADVVILENERKISGVPLIAFRQKEVSRLIASVMDIKDPEGGEAAPPAKPAKAAEPVKHSKNTKAVTLPRPAPPAASAKRPVSVAKPALVPAPSSSLLDEGGVLRPKATAPLPKVETPVADALPIAMVSPKVDSPAMTSSEKASKAETVNASKSQKDENKTRAKDKLQSEVSHEEALALIKSSGMTLRQIADLFGVSRSMISFYISGRNSMPLDRYRLLSDAVNSRDASGTDPREERKKRQETVSTQEAVALIRGGGMTFDEIGTVLKISKSMIGSYLSGRYKMPRVRFEALAQVVEDREKMTVDPSAALPDVEGSPDSGPVPSSESQDAVEIAVAAQLQEQIVEPPRETEAETNVMLPSPSSPKGEDALRRILEALATRTSETVDVARIEAGLAAIEQRLARIEALLAERPAEPCKASKILAAIAACAEA